MLWINTFGALRHLALKSLCSTGTINFGSIQGRGDRAKINRKLEGIKDRKVV